MAVMFNPTGLNITAMVLVFWLFHPPKDQPVREHLSLVPFLWNSLPRHIREEGSVDAFK